MILKSGHIALMTNHVHYVCVPGNENSLSKAFNALHMRYSQYFNHKKGSRGHLWQGRFFSCILDETHTFTAVRYVENNPVRAGIVKTPEAYQWSSARTHINRGEDAILSKDCYLEESIKDWSLYLKGEDDRVVDTIRKNTLAGRPCGDGSFIHRIEGLLGRQLKAKAWGRPRKDKK